MASVSQICSKVILLEKGKLTCKSEPDIAIEKYITSISHENYFWAREEPLNPVANFIKAGILNLKGEFVRVVSNNPEGKNFILLEVNVRDSNFSGTFAFEITNQMGQSVFCSHDYDNNCRITAPGDYIFQIQLPDILKTGNYFVTLGSNLVGNSTLEHIQAAFRFEYVDEIQAGQSNHRPGLIFLPLKWELFQNEINS